MPASGASRYLLYATVALVAAPWCALLLGCAEGPLARYGSLNPWVKSGWEKEEAEYGPSFDTRVSRLRALRGRAPMLNRDEQERTSQELVQILKNEDNQAVRSEVVYALGALPTETAAEGLREALNDSEPELRVAACGAWRRRGGPEALQRLSAVVGSDTDTDVRLAATRALSGFRDPGAVKALGLALEDPNPAMQHQAVISLRQVSGRDFGGDIAAWRDYARGNQAEQAPPPNVAERFFKWK